MEGLWPALKRFLKLPGAERGGGDADNISVSTRVIPNGETTLTDSSVIQTENQSTTNETQSDISENSTVPVLTNGNSQEKANCAESSQVTCVNNTLDCNNSSSSEVPICSSENNLNGLQIAENATVSATSADSSSGRNGISVSVPPLSESSLTIPLLPPPFLKIELLPDKNIVSDF